MQLTDEQKKKVAQWVTAGDGISEVQKKISAEFNVNLTFMDVRFIIDDLGVGLKNKKENIARPVSDLNARDDGSLSSGTTVAVDKDDLTGAAGASAVTIEVDRVTKPGAVASGTVGFSDGVKASWMIDAMGRLALSSSKAGYRPKSEDLAAFQEKLGLELRKLGF